MHSRAAQHNMHRLSARLLVYSCTLRHALHLLPHLPDCAVTQQVCLHAVPWGPDLNVCAAPQGRPRVVSQLYCLPVLRNPQDPSVQRPEKVTCTLDAAYHTEATVLPVYARFGLLYPVLSRSRILYINTNRKSLFTSPFVGGLVVE